MQTVHPSPVSQQANWRYARGKDWLKLHSGNAVHHFGFPEQETEDFAVDKKEHEVTDDWDANATAKGRAQVHKADEGQLYFTLMDGRRNPTYRMNHHYENSWKVVPKKKKEKAASFVAKALNKGIDLALTPGAIQPWWARVLAGGGLGAAYHVARQNLYNTDEENAEENSDNKTVLRRILFPAAGMGIVGGVQRALFKDGPGNPGYYQKRQIGQGSTLF